VTVFACEVNLRIATGVDEKVWVRVLSHSIFSSLHTPCLVVGTAWFPIVPQTRGDLVHLITSHVHKLVGELFPVSRVPRWFPRASQACDENGLFKRLWINQPCRSVKHFEFARGNSFCEVAFITELLVPTHGFFEVCPTYMKP
jgi:hypothetical protein